MEKKLPEMTGESFFGKGSLISKGLFTLSRENARRSNFAPFLGDWSQSGKLSEIKLPLAEMQAAAKQADSHLKGNILELT